MSREKKITQRSYHVALWFLLISAFACDPCYELATQLCDCKQTEEERSTCKKNLSLAKAHKFFDVAKDANTCKKALQECTCKKIAEGNDLECGIYRSRL